MDLAAVQLDRGIDRVAVPSGQPEQPIAAAVLFLAVGEVEELARWTRGVQPEVAGVRQSERSAEPQIGAERRRQAVEQVDRVLRRVVPVAGSLDLTALRAIAIKTGVYRRTPLR